MVSIPVWVKKVQMPGLVHTLAHSKQDTRYNASLVFFLSKRARRLALISFSVLFYLVTKSFNTYFKYSY